MGLLDDSLERVDLAVDAAKAALKVDGAVGAKVRCSLCRLNTAFLIELNLT